MMTTMLHTTGDNAMFNFVEARAKLKAQIDKGFSKTPKGRNVYPLWFKILMADYVINLSAKQNNELSSDERAFRMSIATSPLVEFQLSGKAANPSPVWSSPVNYWVKQRREGALSYESVTAVSNHIHNKQGGGDSSVQQSGEDKLVKVLRELKNLKATKVDNDKKIARLMVECQQIEQQNKDIDGLIGKLSAAIIDTL